MFELQVMVTKMCIINLTQNLLRDYQENLQNGEGEKDEYHDFRSRKK